MNIIRRDVIFLRSTSLFSAYCRQSSQTVKGLGMPLKENWYAPKREYNKDLKTFL